MAPPDALVPGPYRCLVVALCLAATVVLMVVLSVQGWPLRTAAAPWGVLSYEFAWTRNDADAVIRSWAGVRETAEWQLLIDFAFLVVYPVAFSFACGAVAGTDGNELPAAGAFIAWAVLLAGPLDAVENLALLRMLHHGASGALAQVAGWSAALKFLLIFAALGYTVLARARVLIGRLF